MDDRNTLENEPAAKTMGTRAIQGPRQLKVDAQDHDEPRVMPRGQCRLIEPSGETNVRMVGRSLRKMRTQEPGGRPPKSAATAKEEKEEDSTYTLAMGASVVFTGLEGARGPRGL